jgi:hypothetical protein
MGKAKRIIFKISLIVLAIIVAVSGFLKSTPQFLYLIVLITGLGPGSYYYQLYAAL